MSDVTTLNKCDLGSDHRLVRAKVKLNLKEERNKLIKPHRFPTSDETKMMSFDNTTLYIGRNEILRV